MAPYGLGAIQVLCNTVGLRGWEGVRFPEKKCYEDVLINLMSVTKGWVSKIQETKHYVTLEWPLAK